ncbi:hypothetical protein, partial [Campylobacter rectus]
WKPDLKQTRHNSYHTIRTYRLNTIGKRAINYINVPNFKDDISKSLGLYKDMSEDFDHLLKAFFRFHPWDGFYKEII